MRLENRVSLVTGGSRGIGRGIALAFAREGADVIVNCSSSIEAAWEVANDIKALGRRALVIQADVSNKAQVEAMFNKTINEFGKIDILVNNAGISVAGASEDLEESRWRRGLDVLLTGVFFCCQSAGKEMIRRKSGKIINIASVAALSGVPERAAYCAAKAGVVNLTRVLACEWARYNINVNAIAPGAVKTDMVKELIAKGILTEKGHIARTPAGRAGTPEDMAAAVVFLASEDSAYITGQTIPVDGGWTSYLYLDSWLAESRKTQ